MSGDGSSSNGRLCTLHVRATVVVIGKWKLTLISILVQTVFVGQLAAAVVVFDAIHNDDEIIRTVW